MLVRGNSDAEVPERDVVGSQVRRRARAGTQKRKRLSLLQQIPQTSPATQGRDNNSRKSVNNLENNIIYFILFFNITLLFINWTRHYKNCRNRNEAESEFSIFNM